MPLESTACTLQRRCDGEGCSRESCSGGGLYALKTFLIWLYCNTAVPNPTSGSKKETRGKKPRYAAELPSPGNRLPPVCTHFIMALFSTIGGDVCSARQCTESSVGNDTILPSYMKLRCNPLNSAAQSVATPLRGGAIHRESLLEVCMCVWWGARQARGHTFPPSGWVLHAACKVHPDCAVKG